MFRTEKMEKTILDYFVVIIPTNSAKQKTKLMKTQFYNMTKSYPHYKNKYVKIKYSFGCRRNLII